MDGRMSLIIIRSGPFFWVYILWLYIAICRNATGGEGDRFHWRFLSLKISNIKVNRSAGRDSHCAFALFSTEIFFFS